MEVNLDEVRAAISALGIDAEENWFSIYLDERVTPNPIYQIWNSITETIAEVPEFWKNREREKPTAEFIAAVNPVKIQEMLNYIDYLEDKMNNQYDAIRNLHDSVGV